MGKFLCDRGKLLELRLEKVGDRTYRELDGLERPPVLSEQGTEPWPVFIIQRTGEGDGLECWYPPLGKPLAESVWRADWGMDESAQRP